MRSGTTEGGRKVSKSAVLGGVFALAMLGLIWYASASLAKHSCEVCIDYKGQSACRKAEGATSDEARRTAVDLACAMLAAGMTDSLACQRTEPKSVTCDGGYAAGSAR
jgi:3-deoxy-D-manno-octulosonic acid (KDO) 8-phosphate synthase